MSNWMRVKTKITNLEVFKQVCEQHDVSLVNPVSGYMGGMHVVAVLHDNLKSMVERHDEAYVSQASDGYELNIDNDPNWCSITQRVGQNGGIIMRDYALEMTKQVIRAEGGMIGQVREQPNKSILMKVSIG